ncbi:MAG: hypothetical protein ACI9XU_000349 [Arenicella sp.]|jgi:hypothetical protein
MKESNKSALISAFIYPGVGHLYLGKRIFGCVLVAIATWALFIVAGNIMTRAMAITDKIISGQIAPDMAVIRQLLLQPQSDALAQQLSTATTVLIIVWIVGIIDSYRLGGAKDIQEQNNSE